MSDRKDLIKTGGPPALVIVGVALIAVQFFLLNFIGDLITSVVLFSLGFMAGYFRKLR